MRRRSDGLIRLYRWQLDEKRRILADLESMRADFEKKSDKLDRELAAERNRVNRDPAAGYRFSEFVTVTLDRKRAIQASIADIDAEIDRARADVEGAFEELKKLETVEARRRREENHAAERREQSALDEMALDKFRRSTGA